MADLQRKEDSETPLKCFQQKEKRQTKNLYLSAYFSWTLSMNQFNIEVTEKNLIHMSGRLSHLNPSIIWACAFNFRIQYLFFAKEMPKCSNARPRKDFKK